MERLTNEAWVTNVQTDMPKSDFTWEQYEAHVRAGFWDEWCFDQDRPLVQNGGKGNDNQGKTGPSKRCLGS